MQTEEQKKKRKKWFIVLGVAAVVMIFGCAACLLTSTITSVAAVPMSEGTKVALATKYAPPSPAPTSTPQPGSSRTNPVSLGQVARGGGMNLVVTEVLRPAFLSEMRHNTRYQPDPGHEYVKIQIAAECTLSSEEDEQCHLEPYEFELTGSSNLVRDREWFSDLSGILEDTEFYSGATVTGVLVFQVAQSEENLILIYEPFWSFLFEDEVFFAAQ